MKVYMSGSKNCEVNEEELKFYGYDKCEDYCYTYCSYYRFGKCYKCSFYKEHLTRKERRMTCEECKYHTYIANNHFCDSKNHKRRTVRISKEDAEKDIDCYWADKERSDKEKERMNE